jgi:thiamine phosphate synthase YjbQ (UPF0047 family)
MTFGKANGAEAHSIGSIYSHLSRILLETKLSTHVLDGGMSLSTWEELRCILCREDCCRCQNPRF